MKPLNEYPTPLTDAQPTRTMVGCCYINTMEPLTDMIPTDFARELERKLQLAREALEKLVTRLDEIHKDDLYKSVWNCYANHGGDYSKGPKYTDELSNARKALAATEPKP